MAGSTRSHAEEWRRPCSRAFDGLPAPRSAIRSRRSRVAGSGSNWDPRGLTWTGPKISRGLAGNDVAASRAALRVEFLMAKLASGMVRRFQRLFGWRGDIRGGTALQGPLS